jgi:predicted Rossmann fold flavoprotein
MRIVIIGGGAAGFMAAITAAQASPESDIFILEKNRTVLNKVRISGGGRCNVTHACFDNRLMVKNYPRGERFLKKLLPFFDVQDTIQWFESRGVRLKTEADGRMFPTTDSSETIIQCLLDQARKHNIRIRTSTAIESFSYPTDLASVGPFLLHLKDGETLTADRLLIATGGYPKRAGFEWIASHQHQIENPVPSLFTFNVPDSYLLSLSGVSVQNAQVSIVGTPYSWQGPLLLTHWGFSGPAVLKLSAWGARALEAVNYDFTCRINWVPDLNEDQVREMLNDLKKTTPRQLVASHAQFGLPNRLWRAFLVNVDISDQIRWIDLPNKSLNRLISLLVNSHFRVNGKSTYKEEFVTAGGVALSYIDPLTLESKHVRGVFFAGEVLDVDGITGGFNFQNAWTTGYVAGINLAKPTLHPTTT